MGYATPRTTPTVIQTARGLVDGRPLGVFTVTEFGAVGDGETDDTEAIQAALDAAGSAGGGTVYIPAGTYGLTRSDESGKYAITIPAKTRLLGAGIDSTTLKLLDDAPDDVALIRVDGVSHVEIAYMTLDGNNARDLATVNGENEGIDVKELAGDATHLRFHDLRIFDTAQEGIDLDGGTDILIENVHIHDCWGTGIHSSGGATNVTVSKCLIESCAQERAAAALVGTAGVDVLGNARILDTIIRDCYNGIEIRSGSSLATTIRNCQVSGSDAYGIRVDSNNEGTVIEGTTVTHAGTEAAVLVNSAEVEVRGGRVAVSSAKTCVQLSGQYCAALGVRVTGGNNGVRVTQPNGRVEGCRISGQAFGGIDVNSSNANTLLITGNQVAGSIATSGSGGSSSGTTIMNNTCTSLSFSGTHVIRNNVIGGTFVEDSNAA